MKSQLPMTQSHSASLARTTLLTGNSPFMTNKITQPNLIHSVSGTVPRRDLAWQIAPNLLVSFKYAWAGVCYAYATQRNFRIHTFIGIGTLSAGIMLQLAPVSLAILALTSAFVMVLELLNTALESVVDLTVGQSYHELAKITKDCAAGAVFIAAIAAVIVGSCLLVPPAIALVF
jgi:diacylglycerol kinase (ATP)